MSDLLTTREVQERLKVDRITIYRMLNDGRLKGVKIGQQWRFPQHEVDKLLSTGGHGESLPVPTNPASSASFPSHCAQIVQDVFADLGDWSAVVLGLDGVLLTDFSHRDAVLDLVLSGPESTSHLQVWLKHAAERALAGEMFVQSPFGRQYADVIIRDGGAPSAVLLAGGCYFSVKEASQTIGDAQHLAEIWQLDAAVLQQALRATPLKSNSAVEQLSFWTQKVARAIEGILEERAALITRLNRIAEISSFV